MSDERIIAEILNAHAQRLQRDTEGARPVHYERMFPQYARQLGPLMRLAERVRRLLPPAAPRADFREALRQELVAAAELRQPAVRAVSSWRRRVLWGAAAGGAALMAGVAAWRWRSREPVTSTG